MDEEEIKPRGKVNLLPTIFLVFYFSYFVWFFIMSWNKIMLLSHTPHTSQQKGAWDNKFMIIYILLMTFQVYVVCQILETLATWILLCSHFQTGKSRFKVNYWYNL